MTRLFFFLSWMIDIAAINSNQGHLEEYILKEGNTSGKFSFAQVEFEEIIAYYLPSHGLQACDNITYLLCIDKEMS